MPADVPKAVEPVAAPKKRELPRNWNADFFGEDVDTCGAVLVKVKANVQEILEVDQVHETFTAIFLLHMYYVDPTLRDFQMQVKYRSKNGGCQMIEGKPVGCYGFNGNKNDGYFTIEDQDGKLQSIPATSIIWQSEPKWEDCFDPEWSCMNTVADLKELFRQRDLKYCSAEGGHVHDKRKFRGTFSERFELHDMPFDRQVLRMKFVAEKPVFKMQFAPLEMGAGNFKTRANLQDQVPVEWRVCEEEDRKARLMMTKPDEHTGHLARFDVLLHVERKPYFYECNVIWVIFTVTSASAMSFSIGPEDVSGRASILMTLLLATIGYKLVLATWLPATKLPYLTFLDKYLLSSFFLQFLAICEGVVVSKYFCTRIEDDDDNWEDGRYRGKFHGRAPPSHECAPGLVDFEEYFIYIVYGIWIFGHLLLWACPRVVVFLARGEWLSYKWWCPESEESKDAKGKDAKGKDAEGKDAEGKDAKDKKAKSKSKGGCLARCCPEVFGPPYRSWDDVYKINQVHQNVLKADGQTDFFCVAKEASTRGAWEAGETGHGSQTQQSGRWAEEAGDTSRSPSRQRSGRQAEDEAGDTNRSPRRQQSSRQEGGEGSRSWRRQQPDRLLEGEGGDASRSSRRQQSSRQEEDEAGEGSRSWGRQQPGRLQEDEAGQGSRSSRRQQSGRQVEDEAGDSSRRSHRQQSGRQVEEVGDASRHSQHQQSSRWEDEAGDTSRRSHGQQSGRQEETSGRETGLFFDDSGRQPRGQHSGRHEERPPPPDLSLGLSSQQSSLRSGSGAAIAYRPPGRHRNGRSRSESRSGEGYATLLGGGSSDDKPRLL